MDTRDITHPRNRTLWSWLRGASSPPDQTASPLDHEAEDDGARSAGACSPVYMEAPDVVGKTHGIAQPSAYVPARESGLLLEFPVRGEALLVKLADTLRARVANRGPEHNPFLLMMSRCPSSRLSIDQAAYVEYRTDRSAYHVAIEAAPDTKVILETTNFDTLVKFIVQYVTERLSEPAALEAAL